MAACFRAGSVWPKPDSQPEANRIRDGFAQDDAGRPWKNASESESGKLVTFCQKLGPMILAHRLASGPDEFG